MTTLEFVIKSLKTSGYDLDINEVRSASYEGVTETGSVIYSIEYKDEDGTVTDGNVYCKFDGKVWQADF